MEKTKLGISVGLTAAILYFLGLINTVALIVAAGCILLVEGNLWLKKSAVQAVAIVVFFDLVSAILGIGDSLFQFLNALLISVLKNLIDYPVHIDVILVALANILKDVMLLILGFMAFKQKGFNVPVIGDMVDKHMGIEKPKPVQPAYQQPYQPQQGQPTYQQPAQQAYPYQQPQQQAQPVQPQQQPDNQQPPQQ